ncbi:MAG: triphosphoribosyl-dephospho-CoA synthase, partial [Alphaproteobacteria bacterium]|nr:triphosphoribosyl-dephospho-CoA synthase [Alphaproteobacteria bacterium]
LAGFPDSHIGRKYGPAAAERVRHKAAAFAVALRRAAQPEELLSELLAWDRELKAAALNPGTSADLTVATLFAHRLQTILPLSANSG